MEKLRKNAKKGKTRKFASRKVGNWNEIDKKMETKLKELSERKLKEESLENRHEKLHHAIHHNAKAAAARLRIKRRQPQHAALVLQRPRITLRLRTVRQDATLH